MAKKKMWSDADLNKAFYDGVIRGRQVERYVKRHPSKKKLFKMS